MHAVPRNVVAVFCAAVLCCAFSQSTTKPPSEDEKIERLIRIVAELKDASFIRNDEAHDCAEAAQHMRDKWERGRKHIKTADDFIDKAASKSSVSGKPYLIRFKDGREIESGAFLREELKKIEDANSAPSR